MYKVYYLFNNKKHTLVANSQNRTQVYNCLKRYFIHKLPMSLYIKTEKDLKEKLKKLNSRNKIEFINNYVIEKIN